MSANDEFDVKVEKEKTLRTIIIVVSIIFIALIGSLVPPAIIYDGEWINALYGVGGTLVTGLVGLLAGIFVEKKKDD